VSSDPLEPFRSVKLTTMVTVPPIDEQLLTMTDVEMQTEIQRHMEAMERLIIKRMFGQPNFRIDTRCGIPPTDFRIYTQSGITPTDCVSVLWQ
jgi:hypothetical protein